MLWQVGRGFFLYRNQQMMFSTLWFETQHCAELRSSHIYRYLVNFCGWNPVISIEIQAISLKGEIFTTQISQMVHYTINNRLFCLWNITAILLMWQHLYCLLLFSWIKELEKTKTIFFSSWFVKWLGRFSNLMDTHQATFKS